jgi:hypothetical protein
VSTRPGQLCEVAWALGNPAAFVVAFCVHSALFSYYPFRCRLYRRGCRSRVHGCPWTGAPTCPR